MTDRAHDKATYEDLRYVYHNYALALMDCADARAEVIGVVQQRRLYVAWTVHRLDDNVTDYCNGVKVAWNNALLLDKP